MLEADPEYYQNLRKQLKMQGYWTNLSMAAFTICIIFAFKAGAITGWPWLLGSLVALVFVLSARFDHLQTSLLIQIYLANTK